MTSTKGRAAKLGALAFAAIALVCAAGAAFMVSRILQASGFRQERRVPVVVASRSIAAGERLSSAMLKVGSWPEANVPPGAFSSLEALLKGPHPPVVSAGIQPGEPIIRARLASSSNGTALAALVQPGLRAVAVKVDNAVTRARLVYPGAYVDLVGTVRGRSNVSSRIIVERIRVLSVEARTDVETFKSENQENGGVVARAERQDTVVTVEVTPTQLELVVLASRGGNVDVALRNASDAQQIDTAGATPVQLERSAKQAVKEESSRAEKQLERRCPRHHRRNSMNRQGLAKRAAEIEVFDAR